MPSPRSTSPRKRAPTGLETNKPVVMRLMPSERDRITAAAHVEQRTLSSFCRLAVLRGLAEYDQDPLALLPKD